MVTIDRIKEVLKKALAMNSKPTEESFPELPEVLIWQRFLFGVLYGFYLGLNGVRSGVMPLQALNLICFVPLVYVRLFLGADSETFVSQALFSGTFQAVAICLLIWIYFFTADHPDDEAKLSTLLASVAAPDEGLSGLNDATAASSGTVPSGEDSEF